MTEIFREQIAGTRKMDLELKLRELQEEYKSLDLSIQDNCIVVTIETKKIKVNLERDRYFRNQRSSTAILKRRVKRNIFNNKCRYFYKSFRNQLREQNMSSDEIKIKLQKLRKDRRISARGRHLSDGLQRPDKNKSLSNINNFIVNDISNKEATRGH